MYTFVFSEYSTLFHVITCFAKIIALFFGYFTDFLLSLHRQTCLTIKTRYATVMARCALPVAKIIYPPHITETKNREFVVSCSQTP